MRVFYENRATEKDFHAAIEDISPYLLTATLLLNPYGKSFLRAPKFFLFINTLGGKSPYHYGRAGRSLSGTFL